MVKSKLLHLILINGDYNGILIASQENSKIEAVRMPRTSVRDTDLSQAQKPGVYLLFCDMENGQRGVYIGQADNIKNRLKIHMNEYDRGKEPYYWNAVIFMVSDDLDTAKTRYLENRLYREALEINNVSKAYEVLTKSTYHTANIKNAFTLEEFYESMKNMIAALGYGDVFKRVSPSSNANKSVKENTPVDVKITNDQYLYCTRSGSRAVGYISIGGFTVLIGSKVGQIAANFERRGSGYYILRKKLELNGIIKDNLFITDYEFTSPSAAASVVIGNEANGKVEWRTSNGDFKEFISQESNLVHKKASPLRFSMIGLKPGDLLTYVNDSSIVVKVIDDRHVEYKGKSWSLSPLAKELLHINRPIQGTLYFSYKGKPLTDIRKKLNK